jgi:hypothetical protein
VADVPLGIPDAGPPDAEQFDDEIDAGPPDATPADAVDLSPPETNLTGTPAAISGPSVTFLFEASEPARFECNLDGLGFVPCGSPFTLTGLLATPDPHIFAVRAIDLAGNVDDTPEMFSWTVDPSALDTTITSAPQAVSGKNVTFEFAGSRAGTFACRLEPDEAGFSACASPKSYADLGDAQNPHVFHVRVTDAAGNVDDTPATYVWAVDATGPTETLIAPSGTTDEHPLIAFDMEAGATYACRIDGGASFACASGSIPVGALMSGSHTLAMVGTDAQGNAGAPASVTWTVDADPPMFTNFIGPTSGSTSNGSVAFSYSISDGTIACTMDGAPPPSCASPVAFSLLSGVHAFSITATDAVGHRRTINRTWTVDADPPQFISFTGPANGSTTGPGVFYTYQVSDGAIVCAVDGAPPAAGCASPIALALPSGLHTFSITATDAVGNPATMMRTWTVDATAPTVTITGGPADGSKTGASATFTYTASDGAVTCTLDGAPPAVGCGSPVALAGLTHGSHTFKVVADDGQNQGSDERTWSVDLVAPRVTLTGPQNGDKTGASVTFTFSTDEGTLACTLDGAVPAAGCGSPLVLMGLMNGSHTFTVVADDGVNQTTVARTWTVDTTLPVVTIDAGPPQNGKTGNSVTVQYHVSEGAVTCKLDGANVASCASPWTLPALADGSHTFIISANDGVNTGTGTRTWTVDTVAPTISLTGTPGAKSGASATFTYSANDDRGPITSSCTLDGSPVAGGCGASSVTLSGLTQQSHTFVVSVSDGVQSASASHTWSVDLTVPIAKITAAPVKSNATASFSYTATDPQGSVTVTCKLDGVAFATGCGASSATVTGVAPDGSHTFSITVSDGVNSASDSRTWTVDTMPPVVTFTGGPRDGDTTEASVTFSFTVSEPATVTCQLDNGTATACGSPKSFAGLIDGVHKLTVTAHDGVFAPSKTITWTVDTMPPTLSWGDGVPQAGSTTGGTVEFRWFVNGATSVTCTIDGNVPAGGCGAQPVTLALMSGSHTFVVTASDANHNVPLGVTWTVDATPPIITLIGPTDGVNTFGTDLLFISTLNEAGTRTCKLTTGATTTNVNCDAPLATLANGAYTYTVDAVDAVGNPRTATRTWTVVSGFSPLQMRIWSPLPGSNQGNPVRFAFTASNSNLNQNDRASFLFQCMLDWATPVACYPGAYGLTLPAVAPGRHTLSVRGSQGGAASSVQNTWLTVSSGAPAFTVVSPVRASTMGTGIAIVHNLDAGVTCALDGGTVQDCNSGARTTASAQGIHSLHFNLPGGFTADVPFYVAGCREIRADADTVELFHFNAPESSQVIEEASGTGGRAFLGSDATVEDNDALYTFGLSTMGNCIREDNADAVGNQVVASDIGTDTFASNAVTLEAWANPDTQTANGNLISPRTGDLLGGVWIDSVNGQARASFLTAAGKLFSLVGPALKSGIWHYVALTYIEDNGQGIGLLQLYVDGTQAGAAATQIPNAENRNLTDRTAFQFGAYGGQIDEVRVSSVARTAAYFKGVWDAASACQ